MNDLHPGVPHFPLNCQMDDDVSLVEAEYGLIGFALIVKLYQKIYGGLGYYCEWDRDVGLLFAQQNGVGYNLVSEVVGACLRRGIFSQDLFERYAILTSHGIQKRYLKIVSRRIGEKILPEYALVECAQIQNDVDKNEENVCRNPENVCNDGYTSKVKKSKENKTSCTTTTTTRAGARDGLPTDLEIVEYFEQRHVKEAGEEAFLFAAYNADRGWDCLPNWKAKADLWIARMKKKG